MNLEDKIKQTKSQIEDVKQKKIELVAELRSLEREKDQLLQECHLLNVDPQKIQDAINTHEEKITQEIRDLQVLLGTFNGYN
jgi:uncharacterized protein YlxW (UPF0749 family)